MIAWKENRRLPALRCLIATAVAILVAGPSAGYETQLKNEARYLGGKIAERGKTLVAVIDFTDLDGAVTHLGRAMAEELSVALANGARSFRVIDRTHIRSLLKEHKLAASGFIDPSTARELGRIAGVDTLLTGTITPLGDSVRLSIKVLDSETAQVIASSSCEVAKTQAVESLLRRGVAAADPRRAGFHSGAGSGPSAQTVERNGILFALQGCQRSGEKVICHLTLLNQTADRKIFFSAKATRVFDHSGNEHYSSRIQFGSARDTYGIWRNLVRGVRISAHADFEGPAPELRRLALVEFAIAGEAIQFKDVPIS